MFTKANSVALFLATALLSTAPTNAQATLIADINKTSTQSSQALHMVPLWDRIICAADDGLTGTEPWVLDPRKKTATQILDNYAGPLGGGAYSGCRLGNRVLFSSAGYGGATGGELWSTDGTRSGTIPIKDINPGRASSGIRFITRWRNLAIFQANDGTHGAELWITDGTTTGTRLLKDIAPGSASSSPGEFAVFGDRVFFQASDPARGAELWMTDGTTTGTVLVSDIRSGAYSSTPKHLTAYKNKLYFQAWGDGTGEELWVSDGTRAGTKLLLDIHPGRSGSSPAGLTAWKGRLWFSALDPSHGWELWSSDGSTAGTKLALDIRPGSASSVPKYLTPIGSRHLYFRVDDGLHGEELWRTDGTPSGTKLVADVYPGLGYGSPQMITEGGRERFAVLWGDVVFLATGVGVGREPHKFANGATATSVGEGYAPAARRLPTLRSDDPVLGQDVQVTGTLSSGPSSIPVTLAGVPRPTPQRLFPQEHAYSFVDLGLPLIVMHVAVPKNQEFGFRFRIPGDPSLKGLRLALQSWILGTDNTKRFDLSNGVYWWLGS